MSTDLKSAGTPIIEKFDLITSSGQRIDLSQQMISLEIFEDMFSPCLNGYVTIGDNIQLFNTLPLVGGERLNIKIYSADYALDNLPCNFLHRTFDIIGIENVSNINDYTKAYILKFASPELLKNWSVKISKSYQNVRISEVIAQLMTNDFDGNGSTGLGFPSIELDEKKERSPYMTAHAIETQYQKKDDFDSVELFIEKTKYEEPYVTFPYMRPFDIINWCSTRSIRESAGRNGNFETGSNFLFFENKRGYQYVSLETLLENKDNISTIFRYGNGNQNINRKGRAIETEVIEKYEIQDCYDMIKNISNGLYASNLQTYDFYTKEFKEYIFDYTENFDKRELITSKPNFPIISDRPNILNATKNPDARKMFMTFMPSYSMDNTTSNPTARNYDSCSTPSFVEYVQSRMSRLSELNNFKIVMQVVGNSKHKVGDCVDIDLKDVIYTEKQSEVDKQELNKYYSGTYLITAIKHNITKSNYSMVIEVVKDSFKTKIGQ
jgi:hypothetical protein